MAPYHLIYADLASFHDNIKTLSTTLQALIPDINEEALQDINHILIATKHFRDILDTAPKNEDALNVMTSDALSLLRHDLRSPINTIKNYGEIIAEDLDVNVDNFEDITALLKQYEQHSSAVLQTIEKLHNSNYEEEQEKKALLQEEGGNYDAQLSTILIVDDNLQNHDILTRRLEREGHEVLTASNGLEGLEKIKIANVDLVLLDLIMPIMGGYDFLKTIKSNDHTKHIPVLMISSISEVAAIVECIEAGAEDYLSTPFNPVFLRARINSCLEKKKMRDQELRHNKKLLSVQQQLEVAIHSLTDGFALFNSKDEIVLYNQPFQDLYPIVGNAGRSFNLTFECFLKANITSGLYQDVSKDTIEDRMAKNMRRHLNPRGSYVQTLSDNRFVEVQEFKTPDGGIVAIHKDITKQREEEEALRFMALHDALTGLANRTSFEKALQDRMVLFARTGQPFAVLFFDLDGFKKVNDTLGHDFGNILLQKVATRLQDSVRASDVVARIGGDEFCALISPFPEKNLSEAIAKRALKTIGTSVEYEGRTAQFGVSIGIAFFPQDGSTAEEIMKHADEAMYKAKTSGKGKFSFYSAA